MSPVVQQILESFDELPEPEKQELASEILRRAVGFERAHLSDEVLVQAAEDVFLRLDRDEDQHGPA